MLYDGDVTVTVQLTSLYRRLHYAGSKPTFTASSGSAVYVYKGVRRLRLWRIHRESLQWNHCLILHRLGISSNIQPGDLVRIRRQSSIGMG